MAKFIMAISAVPIGTGSTSLSKYVARIVEEFKKAGLNHELTPMNSVIYSDDIEDILKAIRIAHDVLREMGADRIVIHVNIDARHDKPRRLPQDKVRSVMEKLKE